MPLLGKSLVDPEELLEVLEKIRVCLPDEVHEAQWVVNEKERFAEANEEARRIPARGSRLCEQPGSRSLLVLSRKAGGLYYQ